MAKGIMYIDGQRVPFDGETNVLSVIRKAGIGQIDMDGKFVAIKMHFGELGNISYLRPNYAKAVADVVAKAVADVAVEEGIARI